MIRRGHKIRLNPNSEQEAYFRRACGTARFAYNWGLAEWGRHKAEHPGEPFGAMALKKQFNAIRKDAFPWSYEVTKCAVEGAFANLAAAMKNYYAWQQGQRGGKKVGFPHFKNKRTKRQSFYLANDKFSVNGHALKVPKLAVPVNMAEELRFDGRILSGVISRESDGHWYVAIAVEMEELPVRAGQETKQAAVGVDVGVRTLATLSDGKVYENQVLLRRQLAKLKRLQRTLSRRKKGSSRWYRARDAVGRLQARIAHQRADAIHRMTTEIAGRYQTVIVEDLNVAGMLRNHHLALSLADAAFGEIRRQLDYKAERLVLVNRFFPSSRLCAVCGTVNRDLTLADRTFVCPSCRHTEERDLHAARNLLAEGLRIIGQAT